MPGNSSNGSRRLALASLALPIVAMMGLFGWAGTEAVASPLNIVRSFFVAFNAQDCATMSNELYTAPGQKPPTCKDLTGGGGTKLVDCKLTVTTAPVSLGQAAETAPSGYGDSSWIKASCVETTKGKRSTLVLDVFVATDTTTGQQVILALQNAGS